MPDDMPLSSEWDEDPRGWTRLRLAPELVARRRSAREVLRRFANTPSALRRSRVLDVLDDEYHQIAHVYRVSEGLLYAAHVLGIDYDVEEIDDVEPRIPWLWDADSYEHYVWSSPDSTGVDGRASEQPFLDNGLVVRGVYRAVVPVVDWLAHPSSLDGDDDVLPAYCRTCRAEPAVRLSWLLRQCEGMAKRRRVVVRRDER